MPQSLGQARACGYLHGPILKVRWPWCDKLRPNARSCIARAWGVSMHRGKPVPPAIVQFIVETKTNAPDLNRAQIADRVRGQFGVSVDPSTVGRTLRREGWSSAAAPPRRLADAGGCFI